MKLVIRAVNIEPACTNEMYRPAISAPDKNGKRHGFLRTSYELMEFQDKWDELLFTKKSEIQEFVEECKSKYQYLGFHVKLYVGLPREAFFYKRKTDDLRPHDASNYIKAMEDRLAIALGVDDKYNMHVESIKYLDEDSSTWGFIVVLEPVDYMKFNNKYVEELVNEDSQ